MIDIGLQTALATPNPAKLQLKSGSALRWTSPRARPCIRKPHSGCAPSPPHQADDGAGGAMPARTLNLTLTIDRERQGQHQAHLFTGAWALQVSRRDVSALALMSSGEPVWPSALARHYLGVARPHPRHEQQGQTARHAQHPLLRTPPVSPPATSPPPRIWLGSSLRPIDSR